MNPTADRNTSPARSPRITHISWGRIDVEGLGTGKDFRLHPGGGRPWDWSEHGTRHEPGIGPDEVREFLDHGCTAVVLSRGMHLRLATMPETVALLREHGVEVYVEESTAAVERYNALAEHTPAGGLFHSTC